MDLVVSHKMISLLTLIAMNVVNVHSGAMRNYTGIYHPAGGADPRYLNYGAGVDVPGLLHPRIPQKDIPLSPKHHLDDLIGVMPGIVEAQMAEEGVGDYGDEEDYVISPDVIKPWSFHKAEGERQNKVGIQTIVVFTDDTDETEDELDDGIGNEDDDYDENSPSEGRPISAENFIDCRDGQNGYRNGEVFTLISDPCVRCVCSEFGPKCNQTRCNSLPPSCLELTRESNQCCPTCLKRGCVIGNETYSVGETVQVTACQTCRCGEDGRSYCTVADCAPPMCVDSLIPEGECCPICPNGPNCYTKYSSEIIPAGNEWIRLSQYRCMECRCKMEPESLQLWMGQGQAECREDSRCRNYRSRHRGK